jgi:septation ring formation regulator EzrA
MIDSKIVDEIKTLRDRVEKERKRIEAEHIERQAIEADYQNRSKQFLIAVPQFFKDFANVWPRLESFNNREMCGVQTETFTFSILRVNGRVFYATQGAIETQQELPTQYFDLGEALPKLVLNEVRRYYEKKYSCVFSPELGELTPDLEGNG